MTSIQPDSVPLAIPSQLLCIRPEEAVRQLLALTANLTTDYQSGLSQFIVMKALLATRSTGRLRYPLILALLKMDLPTDIGGMELYVDIVGGSLLLAQSNATAEDEEEVRLLIRGWRRKCDAVSEENRAVMKVVWEPYRSIIR